MAEVEKDEVPGNPYRVQEDVEVENTVLDDAVEADVITEPKFESVVDDELETEVETFAETAVTNAESVVKTDIDVMAESIESGLQNDDIRQIEYSNAIVHAFQRFRAPFSGKIVHIFPEQSAVI